jgi:hypothetical protein
MLTEERVELGDKRRVVAEGELGVDTRFDRRQSKLIQPKDGHPSEVLECEIVKRGSAPQLEGSLQACGRRGRVAVSERPLAGGGKPLEAPQVELIRLER